MTEDLLRLRKPNFLPDPLLPTARPLKVITTKVKLSPKIKITQRSACEKKVRSKNTSCSKDCSSSRTLESTIKFMQNGQSSPSKNVSNMTSVRKSEKRKGFFPEFNDEIIKVYYSMNLKIPDSPFFTDTEKKVFKFIRRKIRNKNSAKKSRQRKKMELEALKTNNATLEHTVINLKEKLRNAHQYFLNAVTLLSLSFFLMNDSPGSDVMFLASPTTEQGKRFDFGNNFFTNTNFSSKSDIFKNVAMMLHLSPLDYKTVNFENHANILENIVKTNFRIVRDEHNVRVLTEKYLALAYQLTLGKPLYNLMGNPNDITYELHANTDYFLGENFNTNLCSSNKKDQFFSLQDINCLDSTGVDGNDQEFDILDVVLNDGTTFSDANKDVKDIVFLTNDVLDKNIDLNECNEDVLDLVDFDKAFPEDYRKVFHDFPELDKHKFNHMNLNYVQPRT